MTLAVSDNLIWGTTFVLAIFFSVEATDFPLRSGTGNRVAPATVWLHLKAMVYPLLASISWYIMAALDVVAGNSGTHVIYYLFYGLFLVFLVVGIILIIYLALHPIEEVLEGRERLEGG